MFTRLLQLRRCTASSVDITLVLSQGKEGGGWTSSPLKVPSNLFYILWSAARSDEVLVVIFLLETPQPISPHCSLLLASHTHITGEATEWNSVILHMREPQNTWAITQNSLWVILEKERKNKTLQGILSIPSGSTVMSTPCGQCFQRQLIWKNELDFHLSPGHHHLTEPPQYYIDPRSKIRLDWVGIESLRNLSISRAPSV